MMELKILTPEKTVLEGKAELIIGTAGLGELGILPHHTPLISILKKGKLRIKQDGQEKEFDVANGFIEVLPDRVTILTEGINE